MLLLTLPISKALTQEWQPVKCDERHRIICAFCSLHSFLCISEHCRFPTDNKNLPMAMGGKRNLHQAPLISISISMAGLQWLQGCWQFVSILCLITRTTVMSLNAPKWYTLQHASLMRQSLDSFLNVWARALGKLLMSLFRRRKNGGKKRTKKRRKKRKRYAISSHTRWMSSYLI